MKFTANLRKFFTVLLLTAVLLTSAAFSYTVPRALADDRATNKVSDVKGESGDINRSYHQLQAATQEYRQEFENGRKNDSKAFLNGQTNSSRKAVKNVGKNARNAFERGADAIKETFSSDD